LIGSGIAALILSTIIIGLGTWIRGQSAAATGEPATESVKMH
jgi:hypothetical protein